MLYWAPFEAQLKEESIAYIIISLKVHFEVFSRCFLKFHEKMKIFLNFSNVFLYPLYRAFDMLQVVPSEAQ